MAENLVELVTCLQHCKCHDWMKVRALRQHRGFIKPNGMIHVDCNKTKTKLRRAEKRQMPSEDDMLCDIETRK